MIVSGLAAALFAVAVPAIVAADSPDAAVPPGQDAGEGTPVTFESDHPQVSVYLAEGELADTAPRWPDPFKKAGRTPVIVRLRPGTYTVQFESPDISSASTVLRVGDTPMTLRVRGGSDGLRTLSSLLLAASAAAVLAGIVVEASYSQAPNGIRKQSIAIPLFIGGGLGLGAGFGFWFVAKPALEQHSHAKPAAVAGVSRTF
jgi:hypothetical protein